MFKFLSRKQSPVWSLITQGKEGIPAWSDFNTAKAADIFSKIDTVYSCVDVIATGFSQIAFKAVETKNDGTKTEVFNHPAVALLNKPNGMMSFQELAYSYAAWKLISGMSYLYLNNGDDTNFNKEPVEINVLRADRMKIVPESTGIGRFEYEANGSKRWFPVDAVSGRSNVIYSRFFHPYDDFYGLSPMQAAAHNIDIYESSLKWNRSLLENSCRPSGMIVWTGEGVMPEEQEKAIRNMLKDHAGKENAGKMMVGGGKVDFKQLSLTPKDVEFLSAKTMTMKDIARVYKVPPILLNIGSDATFSNMAEAKLSLWDDCIIPLAKCFMNELNNNLMTRYKGAATLKLDLSEITALEPRRESQWSRAKEADFLTINERRNIVGYEDVDDGDNIMISATNVPLSFAASDFSTDTEAAKSAYIDYITEKKASDISYKLLNATSRAQEQREQQIQDRLMTRLERGFTVRLARILNKASSDAADAVEYAGASASIEQALYWLNDDLRKLFVIQYETTIEIFGNRILDAFKSHAKFETKAADIFSDRVREWIESQSAAKVTMVSDTTKRQIRGAMEASFADGLTGSAAANAIMGKTGGAIAKARATVISRTETHMAATHGSMEAMRSTGIPAKKVWISAEDERIRDTHMEVDSSSHANPLAMNEQFVVGSDSMDAPGQGSDPAENINCRCIQAYVTE